MIFDGNDNRAKCFFVPSDIIVNTKLNPKRILLFLYLAVKHGIDWSITLSLNLLVEWCKYQPSKHKGKVNDQFKELMIDFTKLNYISFDKKSEDIKISNTQAIEYFLNENKFISPDKYAMIYLDEIYTILNYKSYVQAKESKDTTVGVYDIFLVFCYLRMNMGKRKQNYTNGLSEDENKEQFIEAWYCHYKEIAQKLNITPKSVAKSLKILRDMNLIYFDDLTYSFFENGKIYTNKTIFVNYYKRTKKWITTNYYQIEEQRGQNYYMPEFERAIIKFESWKKSYEKGG